MSIFEHMDGWMNAFNLIDPNVDTTICEATYFLTAKSKNGSDAVHNFGDWQQTENVQEILKERCVCFSRRGIADE